MSESDGSAHASLLAALEEVRRRFEAGSDDWQYGLLRTFREYLREIGVDRRLIDPVQVMLMQNADATLLQRSRDEGQIGKKKPSKDVLPLAYAAAAVSILKDRHDFSLSEALAAVARASGFQKTKIRTFRDNISRGGDRIPKDAPGAYRAAYNEMRDGSYQRDDVLAAVSRLAKFVG